MKKELGTRLMVMCTVTNNCNQSCRHCVTNAKCNSNLELQFDVVEKLINSLEELGQDYLLTLVGGEVSVWPDFVKLLRSNAFKNVRHKMLYTNATNLDTRSINLIKQAGFYEVRVSIDSERKNEHDDLRGAGTFNRTVQNVKRMVKRDIPITSATVIKNNNIVRIDKIVTFMQSLGIKIMHFIPLFLTGRGYLAKKYAIDEVAQKAFIDELQAKYPSMFMKRNALCSDGTAYFKVDCYGKCYIQKNREKFYLGNLYEKSFSEMYDIVKNDNDTQIISCEECEYFSKPILCSNMYLYSVADLKLD